MTIHLRGVREHNLKNIEVELPRNELVVITGPSGSGKSSLAFDTLYAEGQRRYLESLSAYARHFLEQVPKPDVDRVEGLSPALAIQQRGLGRNPRSTVGTITEIIPFLRLLFARLGEPHCPKCKVKVASGHPSLILKELLHLPEGTRFLILAPVLRSRRGEQRPLLSALRKKGYARVRVDGQILALSEVEALAKGARHDVDLVVDRLEAKSGSEQRLTSSIERALAEGEGSLIISPLTTGREKVYSDRLACPKCGTGFAILEPRLFSFNSPAGACPSCRGLGSTRKIAEALLFPDPSASLREGGLAPLKGKNQSFIHEQVDYLAKRMGFDESKSLAEMPQRLRRALLQGTMGEEFDFLREGISGHERFLADFEGLVPMLTRRARETKSQRIRSWCEEFMEERICPDCKGTRLRPEALAVKIFGCDLGELSEAPLCRLLERVGEWNFQGSEAVIGGPLQEEIVSRLGFLVQAGLGYLSLSRPVNSLSGGEGQRVRLATQVGGRLTGVLYVLDEPSVGLHARDNERLIELLRRLVDRGNSLVVVEHDRDIIVAADHVVDLGPGAGDHGGEVVAQGTPEEIALKADSPTGRWLARPLELPKNRRAVDPKRTLVIRGARARNLKDIDVTIPLGKLIAVTGVSGSGKSTLIHEILYRALAQTLHGALARPGDHDRIEGSEALDKVILIDQQPIGRSPRSTPATFTGLYTHLRKLLAQTPAAKARGFDQGRFSFNTKGGRCEACDGAGVRTLTMDFLPRVRVVCDVCRGRRFNRQTLEVSYKGHSIADYLQMTIEEAGELLDPVPSIGRVLSTLQKVGLGYLRLGQAADTLSGGEAQRLKLARELSRPSTGTTLYLLDEPTTGLHFQDVEMLLAVLAKLVDKGNTVLVIEHHPEVILAADWIVDLGPEGGDEGGAIVVQGLLDEVMQCSASHTGRMLKRQLHAA
jgi:excinuclease ABC subunit A